MSQGKEVRRQAVILTTQQAGEIDTKSYSKFLELCDFRVQQDCLEFVKEKKSHLPASVDKSAVQQIIFIVIADKEYSGCMDDFLKLMTDVEFSACRNRFLLYCRVCDGVEDPRDKDLRSHFCISKFKYKSTIIGYKADTAGNISKFMSWFSKKMKENWDKKCISTMLYEWSPTDEDDNLYVYPTGKHSRPFLRDIFHPLEGREPLEQEGCGGLMTATADEQMAPLIYPNRRSPTRPRALVILHFDKRTAPCESMKADLSRLMTFFKNRLGYHVMDAQIDIQSPNDLEERVRSFANDQDHGDSCVLVVLSQANGLLSGHSVVNMFMHLSLSKPLQGKPRLFILSQWQDDEQTDNVDTVSCETFEVLPDAIGSMQGYFSCKLDSKLRFHPHSGMVFGCAWTCDERKEKGSDFIRTLCETYEKYGGSKDVAFMSSVINEEISKSSDSVPRWIIQTAMLFFITDTDALRTNFEQEVSSQNEFADNGPFPEDSNAARTGFALVLTECSSDAARNYQSFLEVASFKVHTDHTAGDVKSLQRAFDSEKVHFTEPLVVIVVVRYHRSADDKLRLRQIIRKLSETVEGKSSLLLIYCEITETGASSESQQTRALLEDLPGSFSISCFFGDRKEVEDFLDSLLLDVRKSPSLFGNCIVGFELDSDRFPAQRFRSNYMFKSNDQGWKKKIYWLKNCSIQETDASNHLSTQVDDQSSRDDQSSMIIDEFNLFETRKKWQQNLKLPPLESEPAMSARALIVHNVIFKQNLGARLGSQHDCQRLADSLQRLGYRVSIRSNLTRGEITEEVKTFSNASDHGKASVVAFMSHGRLGEVYGSDEEAVGEMEALKVISEGSGTKGKKQLAIFQCCRVPGCIPVEASCLAVYPGMIVAHSTLPNNTSIRVKSRGSRFIQSLCTILDLFAQKHDIVTLIPISNYVMLKSIDQGFSQQPWWFVQSKERFYLPVGDIESPQPEPVEVADVTLVFDMIHLR